VFSVLHHLIEDVGLEQCQLMPMRASIGTVQHRESMTSNPPTAKDLTIGRLTDDMEFIQSVRRGQAADHYEGRPTNVP
jgi:hypothetical protein